MAANSLFEAKVEAGAVGFGDERSTGARAVLGAEVVEKVMVDDLLDQGTAGGAGEPIPFGDGVGYGRAGYGLAR